MKKQLFLFMFLFLSVVLVNAQINQDDEIGTRGSFLSTRPLVEKSISSEEKTNVKKPSTQKRNVVNKSKNNTPLGLGYSLYLKGKNNEAIRVNSTKEFHSGDSIRLVVEPNIGGYLYVFHTENDGEPTMIFPDARLRLGSNIVQAHVPYEVPSSDNSDASLQWLVFDEKSATENLYLVLSKTPLNKVPTNQDLVKYCQENQQSCPWRPEQSIWKDIKSSVSTSLRVSKTESDQGEVQSSTEKRSIKEIAPLGKKSSSPTVIFMNRSLEFDKLVTPISLVHK